MLHLEPAGTGCSSRYTQVPRHLPARGARPQPVNLIVAIFFFLPTTTFTVADFLNVEPLR